MIRPTLAASIDTEDQIKELIRQFGGLYLSEKKDGIRGIISSGKIWSREAKPIPNRRLQKVFANLPEGLDGEIMFHIDDKPIHPPLEYINSVVTSKDLMWPKRWIPMFYAFDIQGLNGPFWRRYRVLKTLPITANLRVVEQVRTDGLSEILWKFNKIVKHGGEGICLRNPNSLYKEGRATLNDGCLMRFKKLMRDTATIRGFTKLLRHTGKQDRNAFGLAKRDAKLSNLQEQEELGALLSIHDYFGHFKCGSGFTAEQRRKYYLKGEKLVGRQFVFEYRDLTHKGVPRNPVFIELL